jgi:hypothetical protein
MSSQKVKKPSKWQRQKAARRQRTKITILSNDTILTPDIFIQILPYLDTKTCFLLRLVCKQLLGFVNMYHDYFNRIMLFKQQGYAFIDYVLEKEYAIYPQKIYNFTEFDFENKNFTIEMYIKSLDPKYIAIHDSIQYVEYFIILQGDALSLSINNEKYIVDQIIYSGYTQFSYDNSTMNGINEQQNDLKQFAINYFVNDIRYNTFNFDFTNKALLTVEQIYHFDYPDVNETYLYHGNKLTNQELITLTKIDKLK